LFPGLVFSRVGVVCTELGKYFTVPFIAFIYSSNFIIIDPADRLPYLLFETSGKIHNCPRPRVRHLSYKKKRISNIEPERQSGQTRAQAMIQHDGFFPH
jgi:hypothetical protein